MTARAGRTVAARCVEVLVAAGGDFRTAPVPFADLGFTGIDGDRHAGLTRRSGGREPWYAKGTEMRNCRQLTLVCPRELAAIAAALGIAAVTPEALGANVVLAGVPALSLLPSGTLVFFEGGATLRVEGINRPCRIAGRAVADAAGVKDGEALSLAFVAAAARLRGVLATVDRPGRIGAGQAVTLRVPEQVPWPG